MTVGMNLIDQLSAAAPVASTMHTAAQAVVPAVAPAMPPEAPLEGTTDEFRKTSKKRASNRIAMSLEIDDFTTPKRARSHSLAKDVTPAEEKIIAESENPEGPKASTAGNTTEDEVTKPATAKGVRTKKTVKETTKKSSKTPKVPKTKAKLPSKRGPVKSAEGYAPPRGIPTSWETADEADRKLIEMKEAGRSWADIRLMWQQVTGQTAAKSTLPNRLVRLMVNLAHLERGHDALLIAAHAQYDQTKWMSISQQLQASTGKKYTPAFLQSEFKKIQDAQANGTFVLSANTGAPTVPSSDEKDQNDAVNGVEDNENDARSDASHEEDKMEHSEDEPMADDG